MRLVAFEVEGFKNLTAPIVLGDLGPLEVIHGENNVGKSNLVQAMKVFFSLLDVEVRGGLAFGSAVKLDDEKLIELGVPRPSDIFNLIAPYPVRLAGKLSVESSELASAGIKTALPFVDVSLALELVRVPGGLTLRVSRFELADGVDFATGERSRDEKEFALQFARFIAQEFTYKYVKVGRFQVVEANRQFGLAQETEGAVPFELLLQIYDASQSADLSEVKRAKALMSALQAFTDLTGVGTWIPTYDRNLQRANLLFETDSARIPVRVMGTGIQQIVVLLGRMLMTNASILGIEEPEMNLRHSVQVRLRDALRSLVGAEGGPSQVFITSHSPAFELGESFLWMQSSASGPTVDRVPVRRAAEATGIGVEVSSPRGPVPLGYVSTDGVVQIPARVRKLLGVERGGEIMFVGDTPGAVELVSDDEFGRRYEARLAADAPDSDDRS